MTSSHAAGDRDGAEKSAVELGDEVMRAIGELDGSGQALGADGDCDEVDPEEVGRWMTAIGKALLAIFKP
jgi:hypothetical protein